MKIATPDTGIISKQQYKEIAGLESPHALKPYSYETVRQIAELVAEDRYFIYDILIASSAHDDASFSESMEALYKRGKAKFSGAHIGSMPNELSIIDYLEYINSYLGKPSVNQQRMGEYVTRMTESGLIEKIGGKLRFYAHPDSNYMSIIGIILRNGLVADVFVSLHVSEIVPSDAYFTITVINSATTNRDKLVDNLPIPEKDFQWLEELLLALI